MSLIPNAKVITLIRNPIQMIHSQMEHDIRHTLSIKNADTYRYISAHEKLTNQSHRGYNVNNQQSTRLGVSSLDYEELTHFVNEKLFLVGFTDYMWHTFCLFSHTFGRFDKMCDCKHKPHEHLVIKRRLTEVHSNVNTLETNYRTSDLKMMYKLTKHDQMLWAASMPRFVRDMRIVEHAHNVSLVSCMD